MAPVAITTSLTSPPGAPTKKSGIASINKDAGLNMDSDGASTPYSATSTAVSEYGSDAPKLASSPLKAEILEAALPALPTLGGRSSFEALLENSKPHVQSKAGETVYGSATEVLEAFAVQQSSSVWVYDDASQVGFGSRALGFGNSKVHPVQTREGAGLELAGFAAKTAGKTSVFATTNSLSFLLPNLARLSGEVVINLGTTVTDADLAFADALALPGTLKALASLPDGWDVIFSGTGADVVANASRIYGSDARKTVHVVESTFSGRETTSYSFPAPSTASAADFSLINREAQEILIAPASHLTTALARSLPSSTGLLVLNTLYPAPEELHSMLAGETKKSVSFIGASKGDAEALKAVVLSSLYAASGSSKAVLPAVKVAIATSVSDLVSVSSEVEEAKIISFFTPPLCPLPQLSAHLFLASPSLHTRLAQYGSSAGRGVKSVLSLAPAGSNARPLAVDQKSQVVWVSDPNIIKNTEVLDNISEGGILVLELPWLPNEIPVKLSRPDLIKIKEKNIRVFLLDLESSHPLNQMREQVAFLLLYTGKQALPRSVWKVLDAFYSGQLDRDSVEAAQAGLEEISTANWVVPDLEEGKTDKFKFKWEWDAVPGAAGVVDFLEDERPQTGSWDVAARHLLFREAFAVPDAPKVAAADTPSDAALPGGSLSALRPSMSDETFIVKVAENRRLTPATYDRNVFHLELDTGGTGLTYEIGEAIGIHGWNDTAEVLDFCEWYGLEPDAVVSFPCPYKVGTTESRTVFQLLQQNIDLFGRPGKAFYAALAKLATSKADAMTLKFISVPEGAELFKRMAENETVTFADVLQRFKTARPGIEELVGLIPEIKPRHYSIASSNKAVGDKVELLIVTVDWINSKGSPRFGQCTRYLADLKPGAQVTVSIKPSVMKLPPSDLQPIIMSGLGTGAAPFRAFMQHRAWQRSQGLEVGPLIYYFGSRYRSQEYLYGEEIEAYIASGIISHAGLAFSRDGKDKVYIQHKMKQDKKMLAKLLQGEGDHAAYFYLCGPTWPVPDVYEALVSSLTEEGEMDRKRAEEYIEELKEEERYVLEVY